MKLSIMFSMLLTLFLSSYSQKSRYSEKCDLVRNLLDTADKTFYNFPNLTKDSTITILDIDGLLKECSINSVGSLKIIVINSGEEFEKIKRGGIFVASTKRRDFFVLTNERLDNLTGFRVYNPRTNGNCYWGFIEKNQIFYFKKKSYGWF